MSKVTTSLITVAAALLMTGGASAQSPKTLLDVDPKVIAAATEGDPDSQALLGFVFLNGRDYEEAKWWLEESVKGGSARGSFGLALLYDRALGVPEDYAIAARLFRVAAEKGLTPAGARLGQMYFAGLGVVQDWTEAARWLVPAADEGDASAQFTLSYLYIGGEGGLRSDVAEAYKWIVLATARATGAQREKFAKARDAMVVQLRSAEIKEAQRRARAWEAAFEARASR